MKIGFIGLGNVGAKLAGSLLRHQFDVTARDVDRSIAEPLLQQGAVWGQSGKSLAESSDVIITCLPTPEVSALVMEEAGGVLEGLSDGKVWLEMSTTDEEEVKRIGSLVLAKGAIPMDSPVSGGCHRAATGNISIFTGGDRTGFEKSAAAA